MTRLYGDNLCRDREKILVSPPRIALEYQLAHLAISGCCTWLRERDSELRGVLMKKEEGFAFLVLYISRF